jgi:DNA mismatch endonuclease (patch repair protein)
MTRRPSALISPAASSHAVMKVMRGNRSRDTAAEVRLRSALHRSGMRFRKSYRISGVTGSVRADLAFIRQRVAVFVDGCFWHACPTHFNRPATNSDYWDAKIGRNQERDRRNTLLLTNEGWRVLRIWEHVPVDMAVQQIRSALGHVD